jgi:hypothetical protein
MHFARPFWGFLSDWTASKGTPAASCGMDGAAEEAAIKATKRSTNFILI